MKKRIIGILSSFALLAVMLPGAAAALELDEGRPGNLDLVSIEIYQQEGFCSAAYVDSFNGNYYVSGYGKVTSEVNKNWVHVTCKFTDTPGVYESNAEVGSTDDGCTAYRSFASRPLLTGGSGRVTAAANNADDGTDGGNTTIKCKFAR